ncbi:WD40 repeat-like protein [Suillus brevipes Sb2]|nr:WD40 repeat-like protein [Suillus brevipes Sb2]
MVTGSFDKTLRIWDLETGVVLKKMEGHSSKVWALAVSRDGQIIASGDDGGEIIAWHGENGESLTKPIKTDSKQINSVDFSPDGTVLATGSYEGMTKFWCTKTWQMQGDPIECAAYCIRYSPSGELLAIATYENIQIYNPGTSERVASFKAHTNHNLSLAWTPDGKRLLSGGDNNDPTIREWDPLTWQQVDHPWEGHTDHIWAIAIHPAGSLVASASEDKHVRLWQLSDRQTIGIFKHSSEVFTVTFSVDGKHILSGGYDKKISEWEILAITTARDAFITGDFPTAEELLTQNIHTDANDYTSHAHRSFVMARKHNWDHALEDAINSISIQPSLTGYISKGIALCGKGLVREARAAFDVASMFTNNHCVLLTLCYPVNISLRTTDETTFRAAILTPALAAPSQSKIDLTTPLMLVDEPINEPSLNDVDHGFDVDVQMDDLFTQDDIQPLDGGVDFHDGSHRDLPADQAPTNPRIVQLLAIDIRATEDANVRDPSEADVSVPMPTRRAPTEASVSVLDNEGAGQMELADTLLDLPPPAAEVIEAASDHWFWRIILLLGAWLNLHFHLPHLACALFLKVMRHIFIGLNTLAVDDKVALTLNTAFNHLNIKDNFRIHPVCPSCHRIYPHDVSADSSCTICTVPLFEPSTERSSTSVGPSKKPNSTKTKTKPSLQCPQNPMSNAILRLLSQKGMEEHLDAWRSQSTIPGKSQTMQDGQIWKTIKGHNGKLFFDNSPERCDKDELRIGITLGFDGYVNWFYLHTLLFMVFFIIVSATSAAEMQAHTVRVCYQTVLLTCRLTCGGSLLTRQQIF